MVGRYVTGAESREESMRFAIVLLLGLTLVIGCTQMVEYILVSGDTAEKIEFAKADRDKNENLVSQLKGKFGEAELTQSRELYAAVLKPYDQWRSQVKESIKTGSSLAKSEDYKNTTKELDEAQTKFRTHAMNQLGQAVPEGFLGSIWYKVGQMFGEALLDKARSSVATSIYSELKMRSWGEIKAGEEPHKENM
jgi:hypothetical protein